jgi:thymidylate synthase
MSSTDRDHPEQQYLTLIHNILDTGSRHETRNGVTISTFGTRMEFDISQKIPILTTKRVAWKTVIRELLWFISGSTDNRKLRQIGVKIWDGNASREYLDSIGLVDNPVDDLGPIYGFQWRHSGAEYHGFDADYTGKGIDQLAEIVRLLRTDPHSRRILFSAWNPSQMPKMALPPCHVLAQFYVRPPSTEESAAGIRGHLSCQLY